MTIEQRILPTNLNHSNHRLLRVGGRDVPQKPEYIFWHTMGGYLNGTDTWFRNPKAVSSSHYGVGFDGRVLQWVDENHTAWTNTNWRWNTKSITIETEDGQNWNDAARTDALYESCAQLAVGIHRRWQIPVSRDRYKKHSDVYSGKPNCPGALDVDRIFRRVEQLMAIVTAPIPTPVELVVNPLKEIVTITASVLLVRSLPTTDAAIVHADQTPDGRLHAGNTVAVDGWYRGNDPYGDGRNIWLRSVKGRWFWAGGTNFVLGTPTTPPPPPAPVIETPVAPVEPVIVTDIAPPPAPGTIVEPEKISDPEPGETVDIPVQIARPLITTIESYVYDLNTGEPVEVVPAGTPVLMGKAVRYDNQDFLVSKNMIDGKLNQGIPVSAFLTRPAQPEIKPELPKDLGWVWKLVLNFLSLIHADGLIKKNKEKL